jgi:L-aspartate oxidase
MPDTQVLVIGSGVAGLTYALKVAGFADVTLITKKEHTESNTNYAQGGIAAVMAPDDSPDLHVQDTVTAGAGLCHPEAVEQLVREGPDRVRELIEWGARFTTEPDARGELHLSLGREGGHSRRRIVHAKDLTGREVERTLVAAVQQHPRIQVLEHHSAIDLLVGQPGARISNRDGQDRQDGTARPPASNDPVHPVHPFEMSGTPERLSRIVWGACVLDNHSGEVKTFRAQVTVLATGGCGQIYLHTTNPAIATGDGVAMAYRAGAEIGNMEFIQFHPTTLYHPQARSFLISEAVRGEGAVLKLKDGTPFMDRYHPMASLAPRDVVARAIDGELKRTGDEFVYLDLTHLPPETIRDRFPHIYARCLEFGIDISREPIPIVPAAHYSCGGVVTDLEGRTALSRLFAVGEVACSGVHGANRLASNSLLEALVFADHAAARTQEILAANDAGRLSLETAAADCAPANDPGRQANEVSPEFLAHMKVLVQTLMWSHVGIVRSNHRLSQALRELGILESAVETLYQSSRVSEGLLELRNLVTVGKLIVESALIRQESRGLHFNVDHPERDDRNWIRDTLLRRAG